MQIGVDLDRPTKFFFIRATEASCPSLGEPTARAKDEARWRRELRVAQPLATNASLSRIDGPDK